MKIIKNIYLKFLSFFKKKTPLPEDLETALSMVELQKQRDVFDNELRVLAGLTKKRKKTANEQAYEQILLEETQIEYDYLIQSKYQLTKIKAEAQRKAKVELKKNEEAVAMANAMEGRRQIINEEGKTFKNLWTKFSETHIKKRAPKISDFKKFLIEQGYVKKAFIKKIDVTAIFIDNKIVNFEEFRIEMQRVNESVI